MLFLVHITLADGQTLWSLQEGHTRQDVVDGAFGYLAGKSLHRDDLRKGAAVTAVPVGEYLWIAAPKKDKT